MQKLLYLSTAVLLAAAVPSIQAQQQRSRPSSQQSADSTKGKPPSAEEFREVADTSQGTVTVEGQAIPYTAIAGTLVLDQEDLDEDVTDRNAPTASMFYVAYFRKGNAGEKRPITFLYNGGPGSASMWLHMGSFGPKRVVVNDSAHTHAAPYDLVSIEYSLLVASDLVFIDAPGTGFSRIRGKDANKFFYGVDQDARAFSAFIMKFVSHYGRWNSPKYLFGESYGTTRSAVLANMLGNDHNVDLNGVILLSQILSFTNSVDNPTGNPGVDQAYALALPTYSATAWYHGKLPNKPARLEPFLDEVEKFALGDYMHALAEGAALPQAEKQAVASKLHDYTGLPVAYLIKADLRVTGGEFEHELLADSDRSTGRLDTRYSGPSMDPLGQSSDYDPQSAAISSAYIATFNDYVRETLGFGKDRVYHPSGNVRPWDMSHRAPGQRFGGRGAANVMPDLAAAMKQNPTLQVMLNAGYYDLATPFFEGVYEMQHLPMPTELQKNIHYAFYESGHMVYVRVPVLKQLHDNVAKFIRETDNLGQ
jgi:carboxypeptidase C (cathepsin A)